MGLGGIIAISVGVLGMMSLMPLLLFPFMPESFGLLTPLDTSGVSSYEVEVKYDDDDANGSDDPNAAADKASAGSAAAGATIDGRNAIVEDHPYSEKWIDHAVRVNDNIQWKGNKELKWHNEKLIKTGGDIGAMTEAIDVLNGKDYKIKDIYQYMIKVDPKRATDKRQPYSCTKLKQHYGIKSTVVAREDVTPDKIKEWLADGKLLAIKSNANRWRDADNKLVSWNNTAHWGLIFYWDGKYFHMKDTGSARQPNGTYTPTQLENWLEGNAGSGVLYYKSSGTGYNYTDERGVN